MNNALAKYTADLQQALGELQEYLGVALTLKEKTLVVGHDKYPILFRTTIRRTTVLQAIQDCQNAEAVLLADHIPTPQARELVKAGVNFVDATGNCNLTGDGLRALVMGNKPAQPPKAEKAKGRAFEKEGLKVTFAVMQYADKIGDLTTRDIRDLAGVGIGTVHYVLTDLKNRGYLRERNGEKTLENKKELLTEWAKAYRVKLRPKLLRGIYTARNDVMAIEFQEADEAVWGAEMAANKLGAGLYPGYWTIYTWGKPAKAMAKGKLQQDRLGTVEVVDLWFKPEGTTVPPLLAYADLITSGNARNLEAANELEEMYNLFN